MRKKLHKKLLMALIVLLGVNYVNAQVTGFDTSAYGFEYDTSYEVTPGDMGVVWTTGNNPISSPGNIVEGWTQVLGFEQSSTFAHTGTYSMKANWDSGNGGLTATPKLQTYRTNTNKEGNFDITAPTATTFVISAWFYITGTPSGNMKISAQKGGSPVENRFNESVIFDLSTITAGVWTQREAEITITTPDGTKAWSTINMPSNPTTDCVVYVDDITITHGTLSAKKVDAIEFSVFPNPSSNLINVNTKEDIQSYKVLDLLGKTLLSQKYNKEAINLSALSKGVYILQLSSDNGTASKRIVKK